MKTVPIIGYTNTLSCRPGQNIEFKVSSKLTSKYTARLFRSINADPNPALGGLYEQNCDNIFKPKQFHSREQKFFPGSYGRTTKKITIQTKKNVLISCKFFPTRLQKSEQCLIAIDKISLVVSSAGLVCLKYGNQSLTLSHELLEKRWYSLSSQISRNGELSITLIDLHNFKKIKKFKKIRQINEYVISKDKLTVGAKIESGEATKYFNGKLENPTLVVDSSTHVEWDFSKDIPSNYIAKGSPIEMELINSPTRGVKSSQWDGSEMNWTHKPHHYAAIHFHEDDIYDFKWATDFSFAIPRELESGIYIMRLECEGYYDAIPFFVCSPLGQPRSKNCILISTFTYTIYGNHARPDYCPDWQKKFKKWAAYPYNPADYRDYGLSTYNCHTDGSGICYASPNRPLFNLRPGYITFGNTECSGLRHFQADSHLISWFHKMEISYDIITDHELDEEGIEAIRDYESLTTGTHPEYHTSNTLNALVEFRDSGGALNYLGGNGFYWKIAKQDNNPSILEIRRAEDGIRAWASEPGEYYNSFDGTYGGLWRRNGRPPQQLVGVGFTAQGNFIGMPYERKYFDQDLDWIFDGVEGALLGNFGFSGNGAAGFELDRIDPELGNGEHIKILAQSHDRNRNFMLVPEEQLTHLTNISGKPESDIRRADMVYFETETGGSVFSVGSITFCGSLPWNNFNNNISKLLFNIIKKRPKING